MAWTFVNSFMEDVNEKVFNLGADVLKVALTNTLPDIATADILADITQISAAGGYAPATVTISASAQSGGTYTLTHSAVTFTAAGAAFDSARYWVLYDDTATNDELIAYADYGVSYALPATLTWTLNAGDIFTLSQSA
ncbi:MAG: hypothetical protein NUV75_14400 [Gallionella sp.]|nr:hypothetical protein [Gallionella sp.]